MDPGFQFHWLEQTLEKARDKHQTVNLSFESKTLEIHLC